MAFYVVFVQGMAEGNQLLSKPPRAASGLTGTTTNPVNSKEGGGRGEMEWGKGAKNKDKEKEIINFLP